MAVLEMLKISNQEAKRKTERLLEELSIAHLEKVLGFN